MWIWLRLLNCFLLGVASFGESAYAALPAKSGVDQAVSTTITAKKMTVKNQDSQAVFEGAVVLTRGSLVVYSDRMVVMFRAQDSAAGENQKGHESVKGSGPRGPDAVPVVSNRSVNRIEATGRVKIEKDSGSATCDKAIYFHDGDKIVLTGDPVAWDKGTRVSGKQITMFLGEDRSVVEGGSHVRIEPDGGMTK